jgi:hypothetical protein
MGQRDPSGHQPADPARVVGQSGIDARGVGKWTQSGGAPVEMAHLTGKPAAQGKWWAQGPNGVSRGQPQAGAR